MKTINTKNAPLAIGPYSQAVEAGNILFISGQLPINPTTGEFAEGGIKELTYQSLTNIKNILEKRGLTMGSIVKTTVLLKDIADFSEMNETYSKFFQDPYPARSAFAVNNLPKNARIEIECIAVIE